MSKVRIYDLAKEFGLKSKELADRLVAMGYPFASPSSSVDDDMERIFEGSCKAGWAPILGKGGSN